MQTPREEQPPSQDPAAAARFPQDERRLLLNTPGLGEVIVRRLESAGCASLCELRARGVDAVIDELGQGVAWRNRRRALTRALEAATQLPAGWARGAAAPASNRDGARKP